MLGIVLATWTAAWAHSVSEYSGLAWYEQDKRLLIAADNDGMWIQEWTPTGGVGALFEVKGAPDNIEAVVAYGGPGQFLVVAESGEAIIPLTITAKGSGERVTYKAKQGEKIAITLAPEADHKVDEVEGLGVFTYQGKAYAIIGQRGEAGVTGKLSVWPLDASSPSTIRSTLVPVQVPSDCGFASYPKEEGYVREVADVLVVGTELWIAAATDTGSNTGPFHSCVFTVPFRVEGGALKLDPATMRWISVGEYTKVEALALTQARLTLCGTDNEDRAEELFVLPPARDGGDIGH
jgi:hypothetical protein